MIPNTPNADGKLYHVVKSGETLWLIAVTYGVKVADIRDLNYMTEADAIYPGEKLLIRKNVVVTSLPATPSKTPRLRATFTPVLSMPTTQPTQVTTLRQAQDTAWTPLPLPTQIAPADVPVAQPALPNSRLIVVGVIVLVALVLAGVLARAWRSEK